MKLEGDDEEKELNATIEMNRTKAELKFETLEGTSTGVAEAMASMPDQEEEFAILWNLHSQLFLG